MLILYLRNGDFIGFHIVRSVSRGRLIIALKTTDINEIIEMTWRDKTSFDDIKTALGMTKKQVKTLVCLNLKPTSYKVWRKRIAGRASKHRHKCTTKKIASAS
ncbi:TIGR03643 family protein [Pseudovibrio ascidiaceicola]|uniref:TIGR03643 family protein n=1 Tax=Pseudovibrio ascidiaceicola TaxID=285279 RepID=UPI003CC7D549